MPQYPKGHSEAPIPGASMVVFKKDEVLLVQRGEGDYRSYWSLPGGHIEMGESARDAAVRELMEETGIEADIKSHAGLVEITSGEAGSQKANHYLINVFIGTWKSGEPTANSECLDTQWVSKDDLGRFKLTPGLEDIVIKAWNKFN